MLLIDEGAAAQMLCCQVKTLQAWRCQGKGPAFIKIGRLVRYNALTVEAWIKERMVRSTKKVQL